MKCLFYRWLMTLMLSTALHSNSYGIGFDSNPWLTPLRFTSCRLMEDDLLKFVRADVVAVQEQDIRELAQSVAQPLNGQPPEPSSWKAEQDSPSIAAREEYVPYDRQESELSLDSFSTPHPWPSSGTYVLRSLQRDGRREFVTLPDSLLLADGRRPPIDFQLERSLREAELGYDSYDLEESQWRCTPSYSNRRSEGPASNPPKKLKSRPADLDQEQLERWKKLWTDVVESTDRLEQMLECYPAEFLAGNQVAQWSSKLGTLACNAMNRSIDTIQVANRNVPFQFRPLNVYTFGNGVAVVTPADCIFDPSSETWSDEPQACFPVVSRDLRGLDIEAQRTFEELIQSSINSVDSAEIDSREAIGDIGAQLAEQLARSIHQTSDWLKRIAVRLDNFASDRLATTPSSRR